jgi:hypothetical protein
MTDETYTYYRVDFHDCGLDFDYTIVETIDEIRDLIQMCDTELDDPGKVAQITITGMGMTRTQFAEFKKKWDDER